MNYKTYCTFVRGGTGLVGLTFNAVVHNMVPKQLKPVIVLLILQLKPCKQGCGSGSGRIRNVLPGSGSGIIIPDPDPTNMKTNF